MRTSQSRRGLGCRERVLRAAQALFATKGFNCTSTRDVARRARVNEITIFRLFKSKQDLYLRVLDSKMSHTIPEWLTAVLQSSENVQEVFLNFAEHVRRLFDPVSFRLLGFAAVEKPELFRKCFRPCLACFSDLLERDLRERVRRGRLRNLQPELMGRALLAMIAYEAILADVMSGAESGSYAGRQTASAYLDIWLHGVLPACGESAEADVRTA